MFLAPLVFALITPQSGDPAADAIKQLRTTEAAVAAGKITGLDVGDAFFRAMKELRGVCEAGDAPVAAWEAYSQALVFNSDLPNAQRAVEDGLKANPRDLSLLIQLGVVHMAQANELSGRKKKQAASFDEAITAFSRAATAHKKSAAACIKWGEALIWTEQPEAARAQWREALKRDHTSVDLGAMTQWLGGATAATLIQEQITERGEDALLLWYLASAEYVAGADAWDACRQHFERVIELNPAYDSCYYFLAEGSFAAANRLNQSDNKAAATREYRYSASSWAKYLSGNGGIAHQQVAAGEGGDDIISNMKWLGGKAFGGGDMKSAIALYGWCVRTRPNDAEALNNLAFFHREAGNATQSLAAYRQALLLKPDDPQVMNDLAVILHYYLRTDDAEAIALYQQAVVQAEEMLAATGDDVLAGEERARIATVLHDASNNLRKLKAGNRRNG